MFAIMKKAARALVSKAKEVYQSAKSAALSLVVGSAALVGTSVALATGEDPNAVAGAAAITGMQANAALFFTAAWPVIIFITGGLILIGLFKKVANKAGK